MSIAKSNAKEYHKFFLNQSSVVITASMFDYTNIPATNIPIHLQYLLSIRFDDKKFKMVKGYK